MEQANKSKKIVIITASALLIILTGIIVVSVINQINQPDPKKSADTAQPSAPVTQTPEPNTEPTQPTKISDEEAKEVIAKSSPTLVDSAGQPTFTIEKSVSPAPGWYVATLRNNSVSAEGAKVILNNQNGNLVVVAGPGTYFSPKLDLPPAVRKALSQ